MAIHIYHPNKRITGFATSFWYSDRDDTIFATILKQSGWDEKNQNGIFRGSMDDPTKKVNIKLSYVGIGGVLDCIERARPFSSFHDSEQNPKSISFQPWMDTAANPPVQKGFSFSITVTDKQDSAYKNSFYIGLTFTEARLIREFCIYTLHRHFDRLKPNAAPTNKGYAPPVPPPASPTPVPETPEVPQDVPVQKDPLIDF